MLSVLPHLFRRPVQSTRLLHTSTGLSFTSTAVALGGGGSHTKSRKKKVKVVKKKVVNVPKKRKQTPEQEMRIILRKAKQVSDANPLKLPLEEAIRVLRAVEARSPWSAYEMTVKTAVLRGKAPPKGIVRLPKDPKKHQESILVFADSERAAAALQAGATYAGGQEMIDKVLSGKIAPSRVIATPGMVPAITKGLARFLGPKGLMPTARRGTVLEDVVGYIKASYGSSQWRGDKDGYIRLVVGRANYSKEDVMENITTFMKGIDEATREKEDASAAIVSFRDARKKKTSASILTAMLSSRQGPSIELVKDSYLALSK